jgi:hypothetical protein
VESYRLDKSGSEQVLVASPCEHGNQAFGFHKRRGIS